MIPASENDFDGLGLSRSTLETVADLTYGHPSLFQTQAIPPQLARRDLLAQTGPDDGTEVALALPIIERILRDGSTFNPTALILVPTRELVIQLHEVIFQLSARGTVATALGVYEGKPITSQIGPLKHGIDIVVGTPGRVLEHVKRRTLRIEQLKILVLDRTDEMLDLGFGREIEAITGNTPKTRQTVLFSATMPRRILSMARKQLRDPELVGIEREEVESIPAHEVPAAKLVNLYFGIGKGAGVTPRDLVGVITNEGGLSGDQIGSIKIKQNFSLAAVPAAAAEELVRKLRSSRVKGRNAKIRLERFQLKGNRASPPDTGR